MRRRERQRPASSVRDLEGLFAGEEALAQRIFGKQAALLARGRQPDAARVSLDQRRAAPLLPRLYPPAEPGPAYVSIFRRAGAPAGRRQGTQIFQPSPFTLRPTP